MSRIARHPIDQGIVAESFPMIRERLPFFLDKAHENPNNLTFLIDYARDTAVLGMVTGKIEPQEAAKHLRLASQAYGALFAAASHDTVTVPLGYDDEEATYSAAVDDSIVHVARWLDGFFLAALCRDWNTLGLLEETPIEVLQRSRTVSPEYRFLWMRAMLAWGQNSDATTTLLLQAMDATDPERADIFAPDWVLYQDVPRIAALTYLFHGESEFLPTMQDAVAKHKTFYSKKTERRRDWKGFFALSLMGIGALANFRGVPCEIDSEYWVEEWVSGECFGE